MALINYKVIFTLTMFLNIAYAVATNSIFKKITYQEITQYMTPTQRYIERNGLTSYDSETHLHDCALACANYENCYFVLPYSSGCAVIGFNLTVGSILIYVIPSNVYVYSKQTGGLILKSVFVKFLGIPCCFVLEQN